jgi:predicted TIM-barrel fold metal-dependent hydrolase
MFIPGLRFSLAHISWPWCDECIAVYGHFQSNKHSGRIKDSEMFIDFTPGTPPVYRKEAIDKVLTSGAECRDNILFGVDCVANNYSSDYAASIIARDNDIFASLCLGDDFKEKYYEKNLMRFLGI